MTAKIIGVHESMSELAASKVADARAIVVKRWPYFASLLYKFMFVSFNGENAPPSVVTRDLRFAINLEWVESKVTSTYDVVYELLHQTTHVILDHAFPENDMIGKYLPAGWVGTPEERAMLDAMVGLGQCIAVDSVLTQPLSGKFPEHAFPPTAFGFIAGMSTPEYIQLLVTRFSQPGALQRKGCGHAQLKLQEELDEQIQRKFPYTPGRKPAEIRSAVRAAAQDAKSHPTAGVGYGSDFWNQVNLRLTPVKETVQWESVVREAMERAVGEAKHGFDDYTYLRPPRVNLLNHSVVLPQPTAYEPRICIVLDTSGSMGNTDYGIARKTILDIASSLGVLQYLLIEADTAVRSTRMYPSNFFPEVVHGGGGSCLDDAMRHVDELTPKYNLAVVLTDGGISSTYRPRVPVVVVCTIGSEQNRAASLSNMVQGVRELGPVVFPTKPEVFTYDPPEDAGGTEDEEEEDRNVASFDSFD